MTIPDFTYGKALPDGYFDGAVSSILATQRPDGAIPWFENGVFDIWNHLEAAMGLNIMGAHQAADRAYNFLFQTQQDDGSWWSQLGSAAPIDEDLLHFSRSSMQTPKWIRETNFIAYCATACWHYWLIRQDHDFLQRAYDCVDRAIAFILPLQSNHGEFRWTARDPETPEEDALLTGNSSIFKSLDCAIKLAAACGIDRQDWVEARGKCGAAIRLAPERFDRQWESKERFSMDWYYPCLSGALDAERAAARLAEKWDIFVEDNLGLKCVSDEPWVTAAESAEFVLTLVANKRDDQARSHARWLHRFRDPSGAYWMGWQLQQNIFWPQETPPWTAGAVILATDAVAGLSPACDIFRL